MFFCNSNRFLTNGSTPRRRVVLSHRVGVAGCAAIAAAALTTGLGVGTAAADDAVTVVIDSPTEGQVFAPGTVPVDGHLTGGGAGTLASVVYVADLSGSTSFPTGNDCNGDGTVDAGDDPNGDGNVGDTADCEITGITALNTSLAAVPGSASTVRVGLVPFADSAVSAAVDPALDTFVAPGQVTTPGPQPDVITAVTSMTQGSIAQYTALGVGGGTNFDAATTQALAALAAAPAGPHFIFFLSDGQASVDQTTLDALTASGADLRSFAIGGGASCTAGDALSQLAAATGEVCTPVADPATLAAGILNSNPNGVDHLDVDVNGTVYPATLDVIGNWTITTTSLAPGAYTATATAFLVSGTTSTAVVHFTVAAGGPTTSAPPGSTSPTPGRTSGGPILAATGDSTTRPGLLLATSLLLLGGVLLFVGRHRRVGRHR